MRQKLAEWLMVIAGMRKTIIMLLLVIIGVLFRIKGYLDGSQLVDLLKSTTIAFFSANSIEHVGNTIKEYIAAKNPTDPVSNKPKEEDKEVTPVIEEG